MICPFTCTLWSWTLITVNVQYDAQKTEGQPKSLSRMCQLRWHVPCTGLSSHIVVWYIYILAASARITGKFVYQNIPSPPCQTLLGPWIGLASYLYVVVWLLSLLVWIFLADVTLPAIITFVALAPYIRHDLRDKLQD